MCKRGKHLPTASIFLQPTVANLAVTKHALDVMKCMFDFGADAGFDFFCLRQVTGFWQRSTLTGTHSDEPFHVAILMLCTFLDPHITSIAPHAPLVTVQ